MERLRKREEFSALLRRGKTFRHPLLTLKVLPNGLLFSRAGFLISRKVGKAVVRNTIRRRLREVLRLVPLAEERDLLIIASPEAGAAGFQELKGALMEVLSRAGLLKEKR
ncbi:MAG: ribonuclease P protein component [Chloroflexi bacterium]|nr:ribonuclease P protein component [Chloroflexota bacterium]